MRNGNNNSIVTILVAGIIVTVLAMLIAIFIAGQRPVVVVVPQAAPATVAEPPGFIDGFPVLSPAAAVATPAVAPDASAAAAVPSPPAPAAPARITVARVPAVPDTQDLFNAAWDHAAVMEIPLEPQQMAPPMLDEPTITNVAVQALRDDHRIAWRLRWRQAEPAALVDTGHYSDAVAIQIPLVDNAPFTMGGPDMPVRLLQWRALWQKDVDEGFQDVHHLHPNFWSDLYWFAEPEWPFAMADAFKDERSHEWLIAYRAGNPMADFLRTIPVEELVAEGFGTTTHVPETPSTARGEWRDGYWTVVIDRPLSQGDPLGQRLLDSGATHAIALAVWDGTAGNSGGRKHWCSWVPMNIEP